MSASSGFTLVELLVVCAIIVVITGVVLVDNNKFGGEVTLENLAYDIALTIRQTQVYGIAVERFGTSTFTAGYGMHFTMSSPTTYVLFADVEGTGVCDSTCLQNDVVQTNTLQQGYSIENICTVPEVGGSTCNPVTEVDILYKRPEPEAYISSGSSGSPVSCVLNPHAACNYEAQITLISPKGSTSTVVVDATGQISVQ